MPDSRRQPSTDRYVRSRTLASWTTSVLMAGAVALLSWGLVKIHGYEGRIAVAEQGGADIRIRVDRLEQAITVLLGTTTRLEALQEQILEELRTRRDHR